jgi:hypothetical protein
MKNMLLSLGILCACAIYSTEAQSPNIQFLIQETEKAKTDATTAAQTIIKIQEELKYKQTQLAQAEEYKLVAETKKLESEIILLKHLAEQLTELCAHLKEHDNWMQSERVTESWTGSQTYKDVFANTPTPETLNLILPKEGRISDQRVQEIATALNYLLNNAPEITFTEPCAWERCVRTEKSITCTQRNMFLETKEQK